MTKIYLTVASLLFAGLTYAQDSATVLFIGNSYTYVNDMPGMLADIAASLGDYVEPTSQTSGGATFEIHANNAATYTAINSSDWDYVVLQAQSQEPSFPETQVDTQTLPYAEQMADSIYANSLCSQIMMFMTWGRENGDPQWAPISTFEGMNNRLRAAYIRMADSIDASVSPVGVAWKYVRDNYPSIQLYSGDGSHPSAEGTYLAACTFYAAIFRKTPVGAPFISTLNQTTADRLQEGAAAAVMDSLDFFNLHSINDHVQADFTYAINGSDVTFTNNSLFADMYSWDFEDGQSSSDENPTITYSGDGTYTVTLIAESPCDTDTIIYDVTIQSGSIYENQDLGLSYVQKENGVIEIIGANSLDQVTVMDASGRMVDQHSKTIIDLSKEPVGMYLISIQLEDKVQRIRVLR